MIGTSRLLTASLATAALMTAACNSAPTPGSSSRTAEAIIGGSQAANGEFPAVVALLLGQQSSLCTGTLIEPDVVLTAAHCVQAENANSLQVIIDRENINSPVGGGRTIGVAKRVAHPNFGNGGGGTVHDVALVFLDEPLTDREPIAINRDASARSAGTNTLLVGFGIHTAGGNDAGRLYKVEKQISSCDDVEDVVEEVYGYSPQLDEEKYICWDQTTNTGKCQGDSGGPTLIEAGGAHRVAGITSFGDGEGCRYFGIDTAVDSELAFIDQEIGIWRCSAGDGCTEGCGIFGLPVDADCPLCTSDADCTGVNNYCGTSGQCEPQPFSDGGLGADCEFATDCASGLCSNGPGGRACVAYCTVGVEGSCPSSFNCEDVGQGAQGVCWHPDGGSCNAGTPKRSAPPVPLALVGFGLVAWTLLRRQRRAQ